MDVNVVFQNHHHSPFLSRYVKMKLEEMIHEFPLDTKLTIAIEEICMGKKMIRCQLHSEKREWNFQEELTLNAKHAVDRVILQLKQISKNWRPMITTKPALPTTR